MRESEYVWQGQVSRRVGSWVEGKGDGDDDNWLIK